jgi:hypothetical protein
LAKFIAAAILLALSASAQAQDNFFTRWQHRVSETQSKQPSWSPPVVAPYPMLIQVLRADFTRQIAPAGTDTWNYGASRGLNLIPGFNSEFDFYYPPYIQHNNPAVKDGAGDIGFLAKYRIVSANEAHGDYMISAQVVGTAPTGSHSNGSPEGAVQPTLLIGKGQGKWDFLTSLGGNLPTGEVDKLGRSIAWNNTIQYRFAKYFVPEVESNSTYYFGGKNNGKKQNFVTPGITISKFKFHPDDPKSRPGLAFGGGFQIATSDYHAYNHNLIFTARLIF